MSESIERLRALRMLLDNFFKNIRGFFGAAFRPQILTYFELRGQVFRVELEGLLEGGDGFLVFRLSRQHGGQIVGPPKRSRLQLMGSPIAGFRSFVVGPVSFQNHT